jgi:initiation factor 1A
MVKNTGGNKQKKQGRKHTVGSGGGQLRTAKDEDEIYAAVVKIYGGSRVEVKCIDGVERIMIIRNKFKGRGKRDNIINPGTWVLVGLRSWEDKKVGVKSTCDLLEVYNSNDQDALKQSENKPWYILGGVGRTAGATDADVDEVAFVDAQTAEYEDAIDEQLNQSVMIDGTSNDTSDDEIDIDDI